MKKRRNRIENGEVIISRDTAMRYGLLTCTCGHPKNNHFDFDEQPCAHCSCKFYKEKVRQ